MATKPAALLLKALVDLSETRSSWIVNKNHAISSFGVLATQRASLPPSPVTPQIIPTHKLINLSVSNVSRRMEYSESRTIGYSAQQVYNIVASVEQYQQFVPWCKKSKVMKRKNGDLQAQLEIGFPPVMERWVSEVTVVPNHQVRAVCTDGSLFSHLQTLWRFTPNSGSQGDSCNVEFCVSFEFKSLLHSQLATVFFDEVVKQMLNAFEMRAVKLYGDHPPERSPRTRRDN